MVSAINRLKHRRRANAAVLMARLVDRHGALLNRAAVQSIDCVAVVIADEDGVARPIACVELDPSEVVLNSLRNDNSWSVDAVGYNFCHQFDLSNVGFPQDAACYEIRYVIRDTSGETSVVRFQVGVINHDGY